MSCGSERNSTWWEPQNRPGRGSKSWKGRMTKEPSIFKEAAAVCPDDDLAMTWFENWDPKSSKVLEMNRGTQKRSRYQKKKVGQHPSQLLCLAGKHILDAGHWMMSWLSSFWLKHHLSFTHSRTEHLLDLRRNNISRGSLWVAGSEVLSSYFNILAELSTMNMCHF